MKEEWVSQFATSQNTVYTPALTSKTNHHELSPWGQAQGHGKEGQRCFLYHL